MEAKIRTLIEEANVILWSADKDYRVNYISQQVTGILGIETVLIVGETLFSLLQSNEFHPDDCKVLLEAIVKMQDECVPVKNMEIRVKNPDGGWIWLSTSMTPILDENKFLQQIVGAIHDISPQKETQEQLRIINKELGDRVKQEVAENRKKDLMLQQQEGMIAMGKMIGNIAHQWRQPLNSLAIILMELEDAFYHGEATHKSVRRSIKHSNKLLEKMSHTIDDFKDFFKNDKTLSANRLEDVIDESVSLLEASLIYHHIKLTINIVDSHVIAFIHPGELSQVILCLISNARDQILTNHIEQGEITIEIDQSDKWAIISIMDNGGGINENDLQKIFKPYFTTKPDGCGLGLYITQLIIKQSMSGIIEVENIDNGAKFTLFLPKSNCQELAQ